MNIENSQHTYRSCYFLESGIGFLTPALVFCCDRASPASIPPLEDAGKTVDAFLAMRERVIRENQGPNPPCEGCNLFQEYMKSDGKIQYINLGLVTYCNFLCTYCSLQHDTAQDRNKPESYDPLQIARELKRRGLLSKNLVVYCAAGEITVNPRRDEYYDFIEENASMAFFASNAGKFDPRLAHILSLSPRSNMTVSIDAGTEETFRKVRGVDLFRQVIENLAEYRKYSSQIFLKYILLDDNCDDADLEGFVRICSDLKTSRMIITGDMRKSFGSWIGENHTPYEEKIVCAALKLIKGAIKAGLYFTFEDLLGPANLKEIHRRIAALPEAIAAEQRLDATLAAEKVVCYGAGGNCEKMLVEIQELGLRRPDVIWDRNAQPGQTFCTCDHEYPVCRPDFDGLSGGGYGILSTITNFETNHKLDLEMRSYGYSQLLTHDQLILALMAKEGKSYQERSH